MITLVLGAAASGKSDFAEKLILNTTAKERYYIATMQPFDQECQAKIKRHRLTRAEKNFATIECFFDLKALKFPKHSAVLVECLSNLLANCMYSREIIIDDVVSWIIEGIAYLTEQCSDLVIVSNDVFFDGVCYDAENRAYLNALAAINKHLAKIADEVIEVVYTLPIYHKKVSV